MATLPVDEVVKSSIDSPIGEGERSILTEEVVWDAADKIWRETKAIPSCYKILALVGRGSPNTISKHLKRWKIARNVGPQEPEIMGAEEPAGGATAPDFPGSGELMVMAKVLETRQVALDERVETSRQEARADILGAKTEFKSQTESLKGELRSEINVVSAEIKRIEQLSAERLKFVIVSMTFGFQFFSVLVGGGVYWIVKSQASSQPVMVFPFPANNGSPNVTVPEVKPPIEQPHLDTSKASEEPSLNKPAGGGGGIDAPKVAPATEHEPGAPF